MFLGTIISSKATQRHDSCLLSTNVLGINMGICLILTAIVAIVAVLACVLLLLCVKFVTERDERRAASVCKTNCHGARKMKSGDGLSIISENTSTSLNNDERARLTKTIVIDENDI